MTLRYNLKNADTAMVFYRKALKKGMPMWNVEFDMMKNSSLAEHLLPEFFHLLMDSKHNSTGSVSAVRSAIILRFFPEFLKKHSEEIMRKYAGLKKQEEVDLFTGVINAMPVDTMRKYSKLVNANYSGANARRKAVYLDYFNALTAETPEVRKKSAASYIKMVTDDPSELPGCRYVFDVYRLHSESPDMEQKFMMKILDIGAQRQVEDILRLFGERNEWDKETVRLLAETVRRCAICGRLWEFAAKKLAEICGTHPKQAVKLLPAFNESLKTKKYMYYSGMNRLQHSIETFGEQAKPE